MTWLYYKINVFRFDFFFNPYDNTTSFLAVIYLHPVYDILSKIGTAYFRLKRKPQTQGIRNVVMTLIT